MVSLCIPTCKTLSEIKPLLQSLKPYTPLSYQLIYSCINQSAAKNRNFCLDKAIGSIIIQCDDDITGFYPNWITDLILPLIKDGSVGIVSARLLKPDNSIGFMSGDTGNLRDDYFDTKDNHLCTACFAFWRNDLRFDENFKGSGFEDTDYGITFKKKFPHKRIVINNKCRLIHLNEQKNQGGENWKYNKQYFLNKHPEVKDTWHG